MVPGQSHAESLHGEKCATNETGGLSSDEEGRLLAHSAPWLQDIIVFALNTGMRRGEILNLQWQAIDLNRQVLVVMRSKKRREAYCPTERSVNGIAEEKGVKEDSRLVRVCEFS
jgi:integrase